ncbi:MAG: hypothetical protein U5J64_08855 [Halobacteriales archaeon]|nr:hypothetical protein [Halobacteriales archaeon]
MRLSEIKEYIDSEVETPVEHDTAVEKLNGGEIDCPSGDGKCMTEALERDETRTYETSTEIYESVMCYLGDEYVGRKFYDDRSPNMLDSCPPESYDGEHETNVCF